MNEFEKRMRDKIKNKKPFTPKEKSLAKLAPPKDKITFGDVIAGRTKGKA